MRCFTFSLLVLLLCSVGAGARECPIFDMFVMEKDQMNDMELKFYPKHPSSLKTHRIEAKAMPIMEQATPFDAKTLFDEFEFNADAFFSKYVDKRFEITGIAKKIGPDIHNKPSIEISDSVGGRTYALLIFPTDDHYNKLEVGDTVVVRANYLVMSNLFGTVMKFSELVGVKK